MSVSVCHASWLINRIAGPNWGLIYAVRIPLGGGFEYGFGMAEQLTRKAIDALIAAAKEDGSPQLELVDDRERGLRIRAGKRSVAWQLKIRLKSGEQSRIKLGEWPEMSISDARAAARKKRSAVDGGANPNEQAKAEVRERAEQKRTQVPVSKALAQYDEEVLAHHRTGAATRRALDGEKGLLRNLLKEPLSKLSRQDIAEVVRVTARTSPISANRKLAYTSAFFNWCVDEELIASNPAERIRKPAKENVRERFHTLDELAEIWNATETMGYPFRQFYRLLMVLPMRREEIAAMPIADLDLGTEDAGDEGVWILPGDRTKNSRALRVPLPKLAREIIIEALEHDNRPKKSTFVFSTTEDTSISGFSKAKRRLDDKIDAARRKRAGECGEVYDESDAMPAWTLHDLRTSFNTHACEILGVAPHVADRILNHVATATTSKIMRVYNKSELFESRRDALAAWAELLSERALSSGARDLELSFSHGRAS